jgi:UDP-glucose 4-epimerase
MRVLVTGGAGYIGSQVIKQLNKQGYETIAYDNLSGGYRESVKWGEFVEGDLADTDKLKQVLNDHKIEAVMHFASYIRAGESVIRPMKYYQNNVINTLNLIHTMLDCKLTKLIFSSSAAVYGEPQETPLTESHPLCPINPYGISKFIIEKVLPTYDKTRGLKYISFRYFNAAGADADGDLGERHEPETHLIPLIFKALLGEAKQVNIFGDDYDTPDGTCIRDYIHVADLAQAHILGLKLLLDSGRSEVFNLGNGEGYSVKQVINAVKKVTGVDFPVVVTNRREGDTSRLISSSEKAKKVLGWQPRYPELERIVETVWDWERKRHQPRK